MGEYRPSGFFLFFLTLLDFISRATVVAHASVIRPSAVNSDSVLLYDETLSLDNHVNEIVKELLARSLFSNT